MMKSEETARIAMEAADMKYRQAMQHKAEMDAKEAARIEKIEAAKALLIAENEKKRAETEERVRKAQEREAEARRKMLEAAEEKDQRLAEKRAAFEENQRQAREYAKWVAEEKERHIQQVLKDMDDKIEENRLR